MTTICLRCGQPVDAPHVTATACVTALRDVNQHLVAALRDRDVVLDELRVQLRRERRAPEVLTV